MESKHLSPESETETFAKTQVSRRQAKTFRIRPRQDETETSFKCLRHETLQDAGSETGDEPRHI